MSICRPRRFIPSADDGHLDLVPLIDCVFLILLFFMLVGRITTDRRDEQITVPPTKTGCVPPPTRTGWTRVVINVHGSAHSRVQRHAIAWNGDPPWPAIDSPDQGIATFLRLRDKLDLVYDSARKFPDPCGGTARDGTLLQLPQVIVEVRADADAEYRVVQEIQMLLVDSVNPRPDQSGATMQPKVPQKPFVNLEFTTRKPGEQ